MHSVDSRHYGPVPRALIFGKVWGVLWKPDAGDDDGTRFLWWRFRWVRNELEKADARMFSVD
jgi:hypothetical protein